jgi:replicative DNA helicase
LPANSRVVDAIRMAGGLKISADTSDINQARLLKDGEQIYVDHLQSIEYPGRANPLMNMIGEIPGLILFEERIAKQKNISIINLSQVGDKEIARSERFSKRPRYHDAYGSSVLYQKAREFLAVYYPYKDYDENPQTFYGNAPTINDYEVGIEKSSFSALGIIHLNFDYEYSKFSDKTVGKAKLKTDFVAPDERQIDAFS